MQKPVGYEDARVFGDYEKFEVGGHFLIIKDVRETKTKTGKDMLRVAFDTADNDRQPNFFYNAFKNDTRSEKKWSGVVNVFINGYKQGSTNPIFKGFCTSVERSNPGFNITWGDRFCESLKGKKIGGNFRIEEFVANDGQIKESVKLAFFIPYNDVDGIKPPKPKLVERHETVDGPYGSGKLPDGFMLLDDDDEDLPF